MEPTYRYERPECIDFDGVRIPVHSYNTVVVGTGAAGFNAADTLHGLGEGSIAMVTEGVRMGTSRNTGSDKQTYYKLTSAGDVPDSVAEMAQTLFDGGSMHGDIALVEAALSSRCFYKLVDAGVPFPHNRYGEYVGYKTDHDPRQRATSCGPLTSRYMTERLEARVRAKGITVFDGHRVIAILTHGGSAVGLLTIAEDPGAPGGYGFALFNCRNTVWAVGGPAGMYKDSVYPESQTGATGVALEAGARGINPTESQYGMASVRFRWNLSGTYQQVLPRYYSTERDGSDPREFLDDHFADPGAMLDAIFLKGYQWPFDPRKAEGVGSSVIDLLVRAETVDKGRRVFLDYTRNPGRGCRDGAMDFSLLGPEAYSYLERSGALFGTPIERLMKMNAPAVELYRSNGIDLASEPLEIAVCAQHNNGGLLGGIWWESNIRHLFPVGEANGTFGVYRPGGSALNSTQVGSTRAAQYIRANYGGEPMGAEEFGPLVRNAVLDKLAMAGALEGNGKSCPGQPLNVMALRERYRERMSRCGAIVRSRALALEGLEECRRDLLRFRSETIPGGPQGIRDAFINYDMLLTQYAYLSAILEYVERGGGSRGSYMVMDGEGRNRGLDDGALSGEVCEVWLEGSEADGWRVGTEWKPVRPIPVEDNWFENVWNACMRGETVK